MLIKSISGIRGTIGGKAGENLTPIDVVKYTIAYAQWLQIHLSSDKKAKVVVGRDARISGPSVHQLVINTLILCGIDVIDVGLSTTPTVEVMVTEHKADGGIIVTASHNPIQWNALKLLNFQGEFLSEEDGKKILELSEHIEQYRFADIHHLGSVSVDDKAIEKHIEKILKLKYVDVVSIRKAKFKVVVDAVNSSGGIVIPKLLQKLGVENIIEINCEPHGMFAHNPEPLPEHLIDLSVAVKKHKAHLGISVDPDVDRLAFICEDGEPFGEEYTLVAVADYVLQQNKGGVTVSNMSSTQALKDITLKHKGQYFASAVGEVNVVKKMKEVNAIIGGEGNGGVILPELHYGRDALVGVALFLSYMTQIKKTASMMRDSYPKYYISKNKVEISDNISTSEIIQSIQNRYKKYKVNTEDGLKIELSDKEWV
ncbi:MAG: phosphoglucosamine mutase, partial [Bacteroidia bacterium]|nr:phosphoglucosamine mutase [Bacteroidia bacterium]